MTTLVGSQVTTASWMALRSAIVLHLRVPDFDRRNILRIYKRRGFTGRTLAQARTWIDEQCDALGLARDAGLPKAPQRTTPQTTETPNADV